MQDRDKVKPVAVEKATSKEDAAIAKRRKLIGRVLMGSPAVILMATKSARGASIQGSGPTGKSDIPGFMH